MNNWDAVKRRRLLGRKYRRAKAAQLMPAVRELCNRYDIQMDCNDHGYQFRKNEYVLVWSPSSNKVNIQYRLAGHGETVPFDDSLICKRIPKIIAALMKLIEVTQ